MLYAFLSLTRAASRRPDIDIDGCGEVSHDDFGDFLGNTTYLPGLPITNIIKID